MKAVILAGGEGTRLRPLTLTLPKPVVPVVDRPFLQHQLDLLASVGVREVVFAVGYRPDRVEAAFGDGKSRGFKIRYATEDEPLGTGGAVRNALPHLDERTIVFNGDVLTDVDLGKVLATHSAVGAAASIVLTPVPNPSAYGLVETDGEGRVRRFVEKPGPDEITTDTINAGIYILETRLLDLVPPGQNHSIERAFFPGLLARGERVQGYVHRGYWIDIGTPGKYLQVHRDILRGLFAVRLEGAPSGGGWIHATADVDRAASLRPPFYVGPGCRVAAEAEIGPDAVLVSGVAVAPGARIRDSVLWEGVTVEERAEVAGALLGPGVRVGKHAVVAADSVLGEGTALSAFSRTR
jgi:mannose-1-phosphate guanylyltransferase